MVMQGSSQLNSPHAKLYIDEIIQHEFPKPKQFIAYVLCSERAASSWCKLAAGLRDNCFETWISPKNPPHILTYRRHMGTEASQDWATFELKSGKRGKGNQKERTKKGRAKRGGREGGGEASVFVLPFPTPSLLSTNWWPKWEGRRRRWQPSIWRISDWSPLVIAERLWRLCRGNDRGEGADWGSHTSVCRLFPWVYNEPKW